MGISGFRVKLAIATLLLVGSAELAGLPTRPTVMGRPALAQTTENLTADQLNRQGLALSRDGKLTAALEKYQQALRLYQEAGDRRSAGVVLSNIGATYRQLGELDQALDFYQRALAIADEVNDLQGRRIRLNAIAGIYKQQNRLSEALATYEAALETARALGDRDQEGDLLNNIGRVHNALDNYDQAIAAYQEALAIARELNDRASEGVRLNNMGLVYRNQSDYERARQLYQEALDIARELGQRQSEGIRLSNLAGIYRVQGEYAQALKLYEQALAIAQEMGDRREEGIRLNNIALVYSLTGNYSRALEYYDRSLTIARELNDLTSIGIRLNNIGQVYDYQGNYAKALEFYERALANAQELGSRRSEGIRLNNIANIYDTLGRYADALAYYERSLAIAREIGDRYSEGIRLGNLGQIYRDLGRYNKALELLEQSLAIAREIGDRPGEGTRLNNMAGVYAQQRDYEKALKFYQQALAIARETNDRASEGSRLNNIGFIFSNQGNYETAIAYYEQALTIARKIGDRAGEGSRLSNLGYAYNQLGQTEKALDFYQQALAIAQETGDRPGEGLRLNNVGFAYLKLGRYAAAEKALTQAIVVWESLRPGLTDENKVSLFDTQNFTYWGLQNSLVAQDKKEPALAAAERGRARAFVELLASRFDNNPAASQASAEKLAIKPITIAEIKQVAQEQNATLVQYSIFPNSPQIYIWVIKPTGEVHFERVRLPKDQDLEALIYNSRVEDLGVQGRGVTLIEDTDVASRALAQVQPTVATQNENLRILNQVLIAPIAPYLPKDPTDRVVIIPQGELFLLPFAALQDEAGQYLIQRHTLTLAPSIQVLQLTRQQRQRLGNQNSLSGQDLLIVGNPTMPAIGDPPKRLSSLPGAELEARTIAEILNTEAIIGPDAKKSTIVARMTRARIIHLATHGLLDDYRGLGVPGAIALAPDPTPSSSTIPNGLLTAREILDLGLKAELVVLSACDTGRGRITGDGVIGLSRSLISAGTPSVIVSLWKVPDDSTSFLMQEFYQNLNQGQDKATALRQAMLTTLKQFPDPKDWAAFTLIGEAE